VLVDWSILARLGFNLNLTKELVGNNTDTSRTFIFNGDGKNFFSLKAATFIQQV
jgi:hypothetical protein